MKLAATATGGLYLGFHWSETDASPIMQVLDESAVASGNIGFNSYLSISTDDVITIMSPNPELGQNIKTSFYETAHQKTAPSLTGDEHLRCLPGKNLCWKC